LSSPGLDNITFSLEHGATVYASLPSFNGRSELNSKAVRTLVCTHTHTHRDFISLPVKSRVFIAAAYCEAHHIRLQRNDTATLPSFARHYLL
jgi:hypothetical protein